jgi:hypothetical protein
VQINGNRLQRRLRFLDQAHQLIVDRESLRFHAATQFAHQYDEVQAMEAFRLLDM